MRVKARAVRGLGLAPGKRVKGVCAQRCTRANTVWGAPGQGGSAPRGVRCRMGAWGGLGMYMLGLGQLSHS